MENSAAVGVEARAVRLSTKPKSARTDNIVPNNLGCHIEFSPAKSCIIYY